MHHIQNGKAWSVEAIRERQQTIEAAGPYWSRTRLYHELNDGKKVLVFRINELAAFDIHILKRPQAQNDYGQVVRQQADEFIESADENDIARLRSTVLQGLPGSVESFRIMKVSLVAQKRRKKAGRKDERLPVRPDHGHLMLDDLGKQLSYPGYSLPGRMKGLAELAGLETGISRSLDTGELHGRLI